MIRLSLLWLTIGFFAVYAWKDWFRSLCVLIVLTAFLEYPDMPRSIFGLPGLNPWNLLFLSTMLAWMRDRLTGDRRPAVPQPYKALVMFQIVVIVVGFARIYFDQDGLANLARLSAQGVNYAPAGLVNGYLINTMKWLLPFFLMFDGAKDRDRTLLGLLAILGFYAGLALLILKVKSLGSIVDVGSLTKGSLKIDRFTGYHRVDASAILAGGSWAALAIMQSQSSMAKRLLLLGVFVAIVLGQAVTGGRTGYIAWAVIGCLFAALRWRKALLLVPVVGLAVLVLLPAVRDRLLVGFDAEEGGVAVSTLTADRDLIWGLALEKAAERPLTGYGRLALLRTGAAEEAVALKGEFFGHPHNAYLEFVLDNGLIGAIPLFVFYLLVLKTSAGYLRQGREPLQVAVGGVCFALVAAQMITSLTAQTFYPRNGTLPMWCAMGLLLRTLRDQDSSPGRGGHADEPA